MRTNLKVFRVKNHLSQEEAAKKVGGGRAYFGHIERGFRNGTDKFWSGLQKAFNLTENEIERLKRDEK